MTTATAQTADANLIARQLFGRGGMAMVAARDLMNHGNALSFKFKGCRKFTFCKITLMADDTYRLELGRIRKYELVGMKSIDGVYADQLRPIFESETGLYLSLGV